MSRQHRSGRTRGQSLVEFALVAPVLLTVVGAVLDLSRVYSTWVKFEAATRDAAQYVASDPGYTTTGGYYDATDTAHYCATPPFTTACTTPTTTDAKTVMDQEVGTTFTKASNQTTCSSPTVWATLTAATDSATGGSASYPLATVTVTSCLRFHALFAYPYFTQNGDWILRVTRTYKVLVGR
ncbi:MAG: pilus assembly protein [Chloroflexi bacterium]|nr:pilus assembly protein [Chloroflexota bacterium]